MADKEPKSSQPQEGEVVKKDSVSKDASQSKPQMSEALQAGMMQIFGEQDTYKPTKTQVDKILALQEKGMDYTHKERTMWQPKQIIDLASFSLILVFVIGLIWIVLNKAPEYTGEVISTVIGLVGGGLGGYGYGAKKSKQSDE